MKNHFKIALIGMLFSILMPTWAAENHQHVDDSGAASHQTEAAGSDMMMRMHEHMQAMQTMMEKMQQESDPAKRQQLMHEHMAAMHEGMEMMAGGMSTNIMQGAHGQADGHGQRTGSMTMEERMVGMQENMARMQEQMEMMRMMMGQILEHLDP